MRKRISPNIILTLQICEQKNEKKNSLGIEFLIFFLHTTTSLKLQKKFLFLVRKMRKTETKIRVRYGETDQMGVVYYGNYAQYLEQGRTEWLRELGFSYKWMEENNIQLPVTKLEINYRLPARYDDVITVITKLQKTPTAKIEFDYEIFNEKNELLVTASTTLVFIDIKTQKIRRAPDYLIEKLED